MKYRVGTGIPVPGPSGRARASGVSAEQAVVWGLLSAKKIRMGNHSKACLPSFTHAEECSEERPAPPPPHVKLCSWLWKYSNE